MSKKPELNTGLSLPFSPRGQIRLYSGTVYARSVPMGSLEGGSAFPADTSRRLGRAQSRARCPAAPLALPQGDLPRGREERGPVVAHPAAPCVSIPPRCNRVWAGWRHLSLYFALPDIATTIRAWRGAVHVGSGSLFTSFTPNFWWVRPISPCSRKL